MSLVAPQPGTAGGLSLDFGRPLLPRDRRRGAGGARAASVLGKSDPVAFDGSDPGRERDWEQAPDVWVWSNPKRSWWLGRAEAVARFGGTYGNLLFAMLRREITAAARSTVRRTYAAPFFRALLLFSSYCWLVAASLQPQSIASRQNVKSARLTSARSLSRAQGAFCKQRA